MIKKIKQDEKETPKKRYRVWIILIIAVIGVIGYIVPKILSGDHQNRIAAAGTQAAQERVGTVLLNSIVYRETVRGYVNKCKKDADSAEIALSYKSYKARHRGKIYSLKKQPEQLTRPEQRLIDRFVSTTIANAFEGENTVCDGLAARVRNGEWDFAK